MKPAPFAYHRAESPEEAVALLARYGDEAKVLAGGQSLVPLMNFRLARPSVLVDINPIVALDYLRRDGPSLRIGALTRHRTIETTQAPEIADGYAVLTRAARWIGHFPIRTQGTIGGSLCHADPSAEWCVLARLLDAGIRVVGPSGTREVPSADWFLGFMSTACAPDEIAVEICFPRPRRHAALVEYARRSGDFGIVLVAVAFEVDGGACGDVSIVLGGVGGVPMRLPDVEVALAGRPVTEQTWQLAGRLAAQVCRPNGDAHASAAYRRRLVAVLTERACREAADNPSAAGRAA